MKRKKKNDGRQSSQNIEKTNSAETNFYVRSSRKKTCARLQGQGLEGLWADNRELFKAREEEDVISDVRQMYFRRNMPEERQPIRRISQQCW